MIGSDERSGRLVLAKHSPTVAIELVALLTTVRAPVRCDKSGMSLQHASLNRS